MIERINQEIGSKTSFTACNFPDDPIERYNFIALATDGEVSSIADAVGQTFNLRWWFVHNVSIQEAQGGEINEAPRVVLIDDEGKAVAAVSGGIFKALQMLLSAYGTGELSQPVKIRFTQSKTRQGWRMLSFVPVRE
jgi:hypothetical protein